MRLDISTSSGSLQLFLSFLCFFLFFLLFFFFLFFASRTLSITRPDNAALFALWDARLAYLPFIEFDTEN